MQLTISRPILKWDGHISDSAALGGARAGGISGAVLLLLSPLLSWLSGTGVWTMPKYAAALVFGSQALAQPGFDLAPVLAGALVVLAGAIVVGIVFGAVYGRVLRPTTDFGLPMYVGLIYGLLLFMAGYFCLLPTVDPTLLASSTGLVPLLVQTTAYSICLGLFYTLVRPAPYR